MKATTAGHPRTRLGNALEVAPILRQASNAHATPEWLVLSSGAPTKARLPETDTASPNSSPAAVLESESSASCDQIPAEPPKR